MSVGIPQFLLFAQADLSLRSRRESLIASNIANATTPGYRAVDIDFQQDLREALASNAPTFSEVKYRTGFPTGLDGNDVSITAEKLESMRNNEAMQSEVTYLHQSTTDLITALRPNANGI